MPRLIYIILILLIYYNSCVYDLGCTKIGGDNNVSYLLLSFIRDSR